MAEQQPTDGQKTSPQGDPEKTPKATEGASGSGATKDAKADKAKEPPSTTNEVLDRLRTALPTIAESDKNLAQTVETLLRQSSDPIRANQRSFQQDLAFAAQDIEKATGMRLPLSDQARAEVLQKAGTVPGLENERMQALMRSTGSIDDAALVREIRRTGREIGRQSDQDTSQIREKIENLENRTRLAGRPESAAEAAPPAGRQDQSRPTPEKQTAGERVDTLASQETRQRQEESPQKNMFGQTVVAGGPTGAGADGLLRALRPTGSTNTPPWEAGVTPFAQRLSAFEDKMAQGRDDIALRGAEKSGRAAMEALDGFKTGEGAILLNRIREAARSDPGGMAGVLSEMREGGKFGDLRQQFNNALADEKGVSAAYDKAASALARYGEDRKGVEQIIARRPDAANLSAKFEAMDKEIGAAAGEVPSRRDGKNMLEDLTKQVAEMLQKAVESIKGLFSRGASTGNGPNGPSPN